MGKVADLHKPPIAKWKPTAMENIVEPDGQLLLFHFDRLFTSPGVKPYQRFMIKKTSYEKQLPQIARYLNYFIAAYDSDNELPTGYLRIKYQIDDVGPIADSFKIPEGCKEEERLDIIEGFIEFVYDTLFSEDNHIRDKIIKMVDDNYLDDIENIGGRTKKTIEKEYLESLEFTNVHVKIMLQISLAMKIICPLMFHYFAINVVKLEKDTDLIYRFYKPLFEIFDGSEMVGQNKVNMFNKLYVYVKSRVLESSSINGAMFEKRQIFGSDTFVVVNSFIKKVLISENMVKYAFPEIWDEKLGKYKENIVGFNKTINLMVASVCEYTGIISLIAGTSHLGLNY